MGKTELVRKIERSLRSQGFRVSESRILPPENLDKETLRKLHSTAVKQKIIEATPALQRRETALLSYIANGSELNPLAVCPSIVQVESRSLEEQLFRYVTLHWTVPVSSGYGRRLRFLVIDQSNGKLIDAIGLCDPVIALSGRDTWIGWSKDQRFARLRHVMDAFVLGAVPPYSHLLFGKLVALFCASDEVRRACYAKY